MSVSVEEVSRIATSGTQEQLVPMDQVAAQLSDPSTSSSDSGAFRAALERHMGSNVMKAERAGERGIDGPASTRGQSLGDKIVDRAAGLASQLQADQQHVSKALEQATRNGDEVQLMKAMMALSDYQLRVQFVSKAVSKATMGLDQLTRLQ